MINWNNFKAKFYGKEHKVFEELAYQLFCSELGIRKGVFRYKNQTGVEVEPIKYNKDIVSFQAKFYETPISNNKKDIIDSIQKAKKKNPELTKIFFYINQEFSEGKNKKEPQYKKEIEEVAEKIGIEIEWRVPSHFERQLALPENRYLADYFFGSGEGVLDFLYKFQNHTDALLTPIHSEIKFAGKIIKLDRNEIINTKIKNPDGTQIIILTGQAGVGKTAIVKDFYNKFKEEFPIYFVRANEFNVSNLNEFFNQFGNFTLTDFIEVYKKEEQKYIIIDSAEKLSDIDNQDPFLEFLSAICKNGWKVIFTTRYNYLESLQFQFVEVYRTPFKCIDVEGFSEDSLIQLSKEYGFNLPTEKKLLNLIKIPFYLSQYLENYQSLKKNISYSEFRDLLWKKKVQNASFKKNNFHLKREKCFLKLVELKAKSGRFYIPFSEINCEDGVLQKLESDEIIQYDETHRGYFIVHDIYEEWALEKIIDREFNSHDDKNKFLNSIGSSYPIRRAFRKWLSDKLFLNDHIIKVLVEEIIIDDSIEKHWKDEILISVLLSEYSKNFFEIFEKKLLENSCKLLKRMIFLARVACKEVDENLFKSLGLNKEDVWDSNFIFTKPKGKGWEVLIEFIYNHRDEIDLSNINLILSLLHDWNSKYKTGETTKRASLIALYYYKKLKEEDILWRYNDSKDKLIQIILYGAAEIKDELKSIFEQILKNGWKNQKDPYYDIVKTILTTLDGIFTVKELPEYILKLADFYWFKENNNSDYHIGLEQYYCINEDINMNYSPASAYQTPIYWLLRVLPNQTIDFIINFTNKCIDCYVKSKFDNSIKEIELKINNTTTVKQYISDSLWNMYRGKGSPVAPYLLQSIHMALEKFLLEQASKVKLKTLEDWLLYLLRNSKSASITAVVTSIVLAYPDRTFNIAKILFQTKELFFYDKRRQFFDTFSAKNTFSIGNYLDFQNKIYQDERLKTYQDKHRNWDLEDLIRYYQFFRRENISEEEVRKRQEIIWKILDDHYRKLPDKLKESDEDKTWRIFLARMDRRKMNPKFEAKDSCILVDFNPQIDSELKEYSEKTIIEKSEPIKHISLKLWATYKYENDEGYKEYSQYENNVRLVIKETKEIIEKLNKEEDPRFSLLNYSTPVYTCAVLIRDYLDQLSEEDKELCKEIILKSSSLPLKDSYQFQIHDGVEPAINTLPLLLKIFPDEKRSIKTILLLTLFDPYPIDGYKRLLDYSVKAVLNGLWKVSFEDAQSLFLGYLLLKPKYDKLVEKYHQNHYKVGIPQISKEKVIEQFIKENKTDLEDVINNRLKFDCIKNVENFDLEILEVAFQLIPEDTKHSVHTNFLKKVLPIFAERLLKDNGDKINYGLSYRIFEKFARFILHREKNEIEEYLQSFVDHFTCSRTMAEFFQAIIFEEDMTNRYDQFWLIWEIFYNKIVNLCKSNSHEYYRNEIIHNYLLAGLYWKKTAKEWHTLKEREKLFFRKIAKDMGHCPSVLYSISKLLNGIGSSFIDEGISWISNMLRENNNLWNENLEKNTILYLENIVKIHLSNLEKIKKNPKLKKEILIILDFLVERGSIVGFLLREEFL